jgi:hypothetical protein
MCIILTGKSAKFHLEYVLIYRRILFRNALAELPYDSVDLIHLAQIGTRDGLFWAR